MKIKRTENATRNIIFGVVLKALQMILPFVMRTIIIYLLGVEYLGLNGLFSSILQVLNLSELGVGTAMTFSMYKPIAEDNTKKICALLKLYKIYYRIIGFLIFIIGVLLIPFIPKLIVGEIPDNINIIILYLMNLGSTVISYWLFAYKNALLTAHQREDIISKIQIWVEIIKYFLQTVLLLITRNYYMYLIVLLLSQIMTNILIAIRSNKYYPNYVAKGNLSKEEIKEINKKVRDLFTAKLGGTIIYSGDTIVISAFLGLTTLAIYQNYYFIITSVIAFVGVILSASMAGIGNSIIVETNRKVFDDFNTFTLLIVWISGIGTSCLINIYQPFMKLWVGSDLMLDNKMVICFAIHFFIYEVNSLFNVYKDASGLWHKDRFRPLITALTNLIINVILVKYIGLYGVILSTIISNIFIGMPWLIINIFKGLFHKNPLNYIIKVILYSLLVIFTSFFSWLICENITVDGIMGMITRLIICFLVTNLAFIIFLCKTREFKTLKNKFLSTISYYRCIKFE